jgi:hypothetical protein
VLSINGMDSLPLVIDNKKGLKIPKWLSKVVKCRTNNIIVKEQAMRYKTLHRKLKIEQDESR